MLAFEKSAELEISSGTSLVIAIMLSNIARLEYLLQPIAFGFGTALVAMVGTNWGARQYHRARAIGWTGAAIVASVCGMIGLIVAVNPTLWLSLFSNDPEVFRVGGLYLRLVGPSYVCFGLGLGLFFVAQGFGRGAAAASANAGRLVANVAGGLAAIYWFGLDLTGFFAAIAVGFCLYAVLLVFAVTRVKAPCATNP
jgi:Na+-driven multidrug efflux pump